MAEENYGNNGEQTVNFEYANGFKGVVTMSAAKAMETKGAGTIVKGVPKAPKEPVKADGDK